MIRNKTNHTNTQWIYELALANNQQDWQTLRPIKQKKEKKQGRNERRIGKEGGESQINRIRN